MTLWVCKLLMLICILTKNVITSCSVTMMLFLHLDVKLLIFFSSRSRHTSSVSAFLLNRSSDLDLVIGKILSSRLSLSKHLAHNLGNLLLLGKIGVFHNRRNASSRLLLLISKHLILCIYLVFRILA